MNLTGTESEILAALHRSARRNIRAAAKRGFVLATVSEECVAPRLDGLCREAFARTSGPYLPEPWHRIIRFAARHPEDARIVGLWRGDRAGQPDGLVAFAVGYHHGDHAEHAVAGSTRAPDLKVPLAYAAAWDLLLWAKQCGASWFDFGGVPCGGHWGPADPRQGIADFKRTFSDQVVPCAEEWLLEPSPLRAAVANVLSSSANAMRQALHWRVGG